MKEIKEKILDIKEDIKEEYEEKLEDVVEEFTDKKEEEIIKSLEDNKEEASSMLQDENKLLEFLRDMEKKLSSLPKPMNKLSDIPILVELVRAYIKKEYTKIPTGAVIAVISALLYFANPIDLIPDAIPVFGFADDAAVLMFVLKMIDSDIKDYKEWRDK